MLIILFRYNLSLTILLKYLHDNLSRSRVDKLLYLVMELINSSSENRTHFIDCLFEISSNMPMSTCWSWAILKNKWRVYQRFLISRQGQLLHLIASTAESLCLLTQFMSSYGSHFLLVIFWILRSKKEYLVHLTVFLNYFQFSICLDDLYFLRFLL